MSTPAAQDALSAQSFWRPPPLPARPNKFDRGTPALPSHPGCHGQATLGRVEAWSDPHFSQQIERRLTKGCHSERSEESLTGVN